VGDRFPARAVSEELQELILRVLIGAFGTRGDVQPMLALSQGLLARGHQVRMVVPPSSVEFSRRAGVESFAVGMDYEQLSRRMSTGSFRELREAMPSVRAEVRIQLDAIEGYAADSDLIVGCSVFTVGTLLAEKLGKPFAYFAFCPQMFPSRSHPSPFVPWLALPAWVNRLSWGLNSWAWGKLLIPTLNEVRAERGLGRITDVWTTMLGSVPIASCDPSLAVAPTDHSIPIAQVGALFLQENDGLSAELSAFLEAGPPPVYVGFGSMSDRDPRRMTERILESVRRAGVRAVISRGWAGLAAEGAPSSVLFVGSEPHGKLFKRCAAVVHHGGAGTTHAAARAGVPQIVMPQLLDQHYWAHRVRAAGIAGSRVTRHGRDPEVLARALRGCLEDEPLRARARELGASIRLDGVQQAVDLLEGLG
jgi:vancomycin aglycone glucosyltransferase